MPFRLLVVAISVLTLGACAQDETDVPEESVETSAIEILEPKDEAKIEGNVVDLEVEVTGIEIVKADGDTSGDTGHFHVFIDREPVDVGEAIPMEAGVVHSADNPIRITGLSKGSHTFTVVVGDGAHNRITLPDDEEPEATVTVEVQGPIVDATAPAEIATGQDLTIEVTVDGVTLVAADKDEGPEGTTGHLHVLIDPATPPAANGQPIPRDEKNIHTTETTIKLPSSILPSGVHTIWIVLGNKTHVPFSPLVLDKITVTVK